MGARTWGTWIVLGALLSCGVSEREEEVSYIAIVPIMDEYLDVYGPIELTVEGYEEVAHLDRHDQFSCDDPAFLVDSRDLELNLELFAYSERHHVWRETLPVSRDEDCVTIKMGYENVWSGMNAMGYVYQERCYPVDVYIAFGGQEMKYLGTIVEPWHGDKTVLDPRDSDDLTGHLKERGRAFLDAMRAGKAVVHGGGTGMVYLSRRSADQCSEGGERGGGHSERPGWYGQLIISAEHSR